MRICSLIFATILTVNLHAAWGGMKIYVNELADSAALSLNGRAYRLRYVSVDSVKSLAQEAYRLARTGVQRSYALENLAFVEYQQMRFSKANRLIAEARMFTRHQLSQLALDVLSMKVAQRVGDFRDYHLAQLHADERLRRIQEEEERLTEAEISRLRYCRSEMHIVASTYFYYLHMDSLSREELREVGRDVEDMQDTAQWLSYHYMLGSGGYYMGEPEDVRYHEMEDLFRVLSLARRSGHLYFVGNAMQAIAEHTGSSDMAKGAQEAFNSYRDLFQEGAALRTRAELAFGEGQYADALKYLLQAKTLVDEQHRRDSLPELQWESRIYERLSMVYSALNDTENSRLYRLRYLDCLELMRQDMDVENRQLQIVNSQRRLYVKLSAFALLSLFTLVAFMLLMRSMKKRGMRYVEQQEELLEEMARKCESLQFRLKSEKIGNVERRTKVALAASVIPYIERMLHPSTDKEYMRELTEETERLGNVLTQWIQIQGGRLNVGITKFALQPLIDTIALNRATFQRQGITLKTPVTQAEVKADKVLTLFMLNTLCDNARKYTPEGGEVTIEVREENDFVEIAVCDTGCGFEESEEKEKGHGFGLLNCKGIIQKYRKMSSRFSMCDMGHESERGKGSRVWFRLAKAVLLIVYLAIGSNVLAGDEKQMLRDTLAMHNDAAFEALAAHNWEEYARHNDECVRLHHILTRDPNLSVYAQQIEWMQRVGEIFIFVAVALTLISLTIFTLLVRRARRQATQRNDIRERIEMAEADVARLRYEVDRLYCQNQILNNCLSTIKHETMYYPARIRQMLESSPMEQIREVCAYYRKVYGMLTMQAESQLREPVYRRQGVRLDNVIADAPKVTVIADEMLLDEMMHRMHGENWHAEDREKDVLIQTHIGPMEDADCFTGTSGNFDAMVAKEILREHDAMSGHPGLRLYVENDNIYFTLWKTSRSS